MDLGWMLELADIAGKIGLAALLGGLAGAEREWSGKWAGLRTHMLVAIGAALITDVSIVIGIDHGGESQAWDPGRIAAQIVSGIGFLGAGTIIQARGSVHGLTTAAGMWVAAAIGLAVGAGYYLEATMTAVVLFVTLWAVRPIERWLFAPHETFVLRIRPDEGVTRLAGLLREAGIDPHRLEIEDHAGERTVKVVVEKDDAITRKLDRIVDENEHLDYVE